MNDAKVALEALKYVQEFLELLRGLHDDGVLLPTAPEWINKLFFEFLDRVGGTCAIAIAILEGGGAGGKVSCQKDFH